MKKNKFHVCKKMTDCHTVEACENRIREFKGDWYRVPILLMILLLMNIWCLRENCFRREEYWRVLAINQSHQKFLSQFQHNCTHSCNDILLVNENVVNCFKVNEWKNKDIVKMTRRSSKYNGPEMTIIFAFITIFLLVILIILLYDFRKDWNDVNMKRNQLLNELRR